MNAGRSLSRPLSGLLWTIVGLTCLAAFALMLGSSLQEAAIVDEGAHIPSGYGYVRYQDFRLNPEHPPLVKALAALPLLALDLDFPTETGAWQDGVNGQWEMGRLFMYGAGNDADLLLQVSRLGPMLLTLLLIVLTFAWSRKIMGGAWALLPTFLVAFSPIVLAHGHYVTTDIGAAFGVLFGTYFFLKFLRAPSPANIVFAGLALGAAQLMKFSVVLLIPYFVLLAVIHFFLNARGLRGKYFWQTAWTALWKLVLVFVVAMALIYLVYAAFVFNYPIEKQVSDSETILTSFAGGRDEYPDGCALMRCAANAVVWMAGNDATRPLAEYFLGVLMVVQRSAGGNTAYFLGEVSASGSHAYFPTVYFLKESLPALLIVLTGFILTLRNMLRRAVRRETRAAAAAYLREHFTEFALALFAAIYWLYSIRSTLNIGVRHLLPIIPIMYMLAAAAWRRWVAVRLSGAGNDPFAAVMGVARSLMASWAKLSLLAALIIWTLIETLVAAPHFLSYFNQLGGGTGGGYRYVTDSNYDWGQDLLRLRDFVEEHPEIDRIAVDYFGSWGALDYYLGGRKVDWWSAKGNPADEGIRWLAVSVNSLQSAIHPTSADFERKPEDSYSWLTALRPVTALGEAPEPDHRLGTSIFVYEL